MDISLSSTDHGDAVPLRLVENEKTSTRLCELRTKIRMHEDAIIGHRTEIYAMSTISCLPAEILCRMFSFVVSQDLFWISLTHVCWYWRRVALDDSVLWSHIHTQHAASVGEFLDRSRKTPLNILISDPYTTPFNGEHRRPFNGWNEDRLRAFRRGNFQRANLQCINQIYRIRSLEFNLTSGRVSSELLSLLTQPAPVLEHLRFCNADSVPEELFCGVMPRLRSLDLDGTILPWGSSIFRGLTRLSLRNLDYSRAPDINQLLGILHSCPKLVNLSLDQPWMDPVSSDIILENVELPSLTRLYVCGVFSFVQSLVKHLILPPRVNITLNWGSFPIANGTHPMFPYIADSRAPAELFLTKFADSTSRSSLEVHHSSLIPVERKFMFKQEIPLVLFTLMPEQLWNITTVLDVRSTISGTEGTLAVFTEWKDLLAALPNLRTLKFTKDTQEECYVVEEEGLMSALDADDIPPCSQHYLCPSLSCLTLSGIAFRSSGTTSWGTVVHCLRRRYQHSQVAELCQLHIAKCINLTVPVIDDLRSCAVELLWDGSGIQEQNSEVKED
ncbi:hypothetical protein BD410DRAFT_186955 [Rickenella mellea]|uniref:F-box domain-containing protein n=1 Tax=Rickenella mellea TaxID=50990 RepID=A0A4Y7Q5V0_9AGAM|nr:hypothetical protein BD410DRAFT_186955 [Rickenella mellea]